ncbi:MAG: hypothetical protein H0U71_09885 [Gammaproteobacteria bacterium]|nr:hypothetical protein [Gammaproteobacteria bacterium]
MLSSTENNNDPTIHQAIIDADLSREQLDNFLVNAPEFAYAILASIPKQNLSLRLLESIIENFKDATPMLINNIHFRAALECILDFGHSQSEITLAILPELPSLSFKNLAKRVPELHTVERLNDFLDRIPREIFPQLKLSSAQWYKLISKNIRYLEIYFDLHKISDYDNLNLFYLTELKKKHGETFSIHPRVQSQRDKISHFALLCDDIADNKDDTKKYSEYFECFKSDVLSLSLLAGKNQNYDIQLIDFILTKPSLKLDRHAWLALQQIADHTQNPDYIITHAHFLDIEKRDTLAIVLAGRISEKIALKLLATPENISRVPLNAARKIIMRFPSLLLNINFNDVAPILSPEFFHSLPKNSPAQNSVCDQIKSQHSAVFNSASFQDELLALQELDLAKQKLKENQWNYVLPKLTSSKPSSKIWDYIFDNYLALIPSIQLELAQLEISLVPPSFAEKFQEIQQTLNEHFNFPDELRRLLHHRSENFLQVTTESKDLALSIIRNNSLFSSHLNGKMLLTLCIVHGNTLLQEINNNSGLAKKLWSYVALETFALCCKHPDLISAYNFDLSAPQESLHDLFQKNIHPVMERLLDKSPLTAYSVLSLLELSSFFVLQRNEPLENVVGLEKLKLIAEKCQDANVFYWLYCYYAKSSATQNNEHLNYLNKALEQGSPKAWDFIAGNSTFDMSPVHAIIYEKNADNARSIFYSIYCLKIFGGADPQQDPKHIAFQLNLVLKILESLEAQKVLLQSSSISIPLTAHLESVEFFEALSGPRKRGRKIPSTNFYYVPVQLEDNIFLDSRTYAKTISMMIEYYSNILEYYEKNKTPELALQLGKFLWQAVKCSFEFSHRIDARNLYDPLIFAGQAGNDEAIEILKANKKHRNFGGNAIYRALFKIYLAQNNEARAVKSLIKGCENDSYLKATDELREFAKKKVNINLLYRAYQFAQKKGEEYTESGDSRRLEVTSMLNDLINPLLDKIRSLRSSPLYFFFAEKKQALLNLEQKIDNLREKIKQNMRDDRLEESPYKSLLTTIEEWEKQAVPHHPNQTYQGLIKEPNFAFINKGLEFFGHKPNTPDSPAECAVLISEIKEALRKKDWEFSDNNNKPPSMS